MKTKQLELTRSEAEAVRYGLSQLVMSKTAFLEVVTQNKAEEKVVAGAERSLSRVQSLYSKVNEFCSTY